MSTTGTSSPRPAARPAIDLCLHLVRKDFGAEVANEVARSNVVPPHRDGGQAQYVSQPVLANYAETLFADTLEWAQAHLHETLSRAHSRNGPPVRRAPSPGVFVPRRGRRLTNGCCPSVSCWPNGCSRPPTCRSTPSPRAAAWAAPRTFANSSSAPSALRRAPTAAPSVRPAEERSGVKPPGRPAARTTAAAVRSPGRSGRGEARRRPNC